jgi:hypothetical protein
MTTGDTAAGGTNLARTAPNILNLWYEERRIIVAQGIENNNTDIDRRSAENPQRARRIGMYRLPEGLLDKFPTMTRQGDEVEYVSDAQHVVFRIRAVNEKDQFKTALLTEGVHVIYDGHSRYGRGPCFGPQPTPSDDWEQGTNPAKTGMFRMGFPVIGVHFSDIEHHGYRFWPVDANTTIEREWRHPELPRQLRPVELPSNLTGRVLPQALPLADRYWGFRDGEGRGLALWAGWEDTASMPMDLGATDPVCRCFCHFGCSSYVHTYPILRRRKGWTRTDTERFAYFTRRPSYPGTTQAWLEALLIYPRRNDNQSWYDSLQWTVQRANRILGARGIPCGLI